ncbi:PREDICTED: dopamine receptor 2-like, partial [Nicrophorus vespilloides]|uniref:Dopamine receptor 2-like n=1 Tax=Nicrophorus vespilloides TaxID=110193 RepID=A0ABM1MA39_NICVS
AFLRILCVCCPRAIRRKYQPAFRSKPSQYFNSHNVMEATPSNMSYSSASGQHELYTL